MEPKLKSVLKDLKVDPIVKEFSVNSFDLVTRSSDEEIEKELGDNLLFSPGEVYSIIGSLISKQPKGKEGALLNNGQANIFYTEAFVLSVNRYPGLGAWGVYVWRRGDNRWSGGRRVFSPATDGTKNLGSRSSETLSLKPFLTEDVEKAIEFIKKAGFKVIKEL